MSFQRIRRQRLTVAMTILSRAREHTMANSAGPSLPPLNGVTNRRQPAGVLRRPVPERLTAVLHRALALEQAARGPQRIPALRLTRHLLAGVRFASYPDTQIAERLGISAGAVRSRGGSDGWVAVEDFVALADLGMAAIDRWVAAGLLLHTITDDAGQRHFPGQRTHPRTRTRRSRAQRA
jgi:hypothetical protein